MQLVGKTAHKKRNGQKLPKRTQREGNKPPRKNSYRHIVVRRNCQIDRPIVVALQLVFVAVVVVVVGPGDSLLLHSVLF
jgi:hypothetical protein